MIVKICGLTTLEDALEAVGAGADMLGFNFYPPSSRYLSPETCRQIVTELKLKAPQVLRVGVFVNAGQAEIETVMRVCSLDLAQLSGDEPAELLQTLGEWAFKALRPADTAVLQEQVQRYPQRLRPPAWLLDANRPGSYGGSGHTADWDLAAELAKQAPILLAGGLTPQNVMDAAARVQPWGVDVASGVESSPGRKDRRKMEAFISAVRRVEKEML